MNVKKKALVVTTVASTIDQFCMNDISILLDNYEVQVAANFTTGNNTSKERINEFKNELITKGITINEIDFDRNPLSRRNIIAYDKLKELIKKHRFDLIHCHTPIAAALTRLAAKRERKKGVKIVYTAHGFHFYKGAPLLNWIIYYPIERWMARYTDILITINLEDYRRSKKSFSALKIEYIPGIGIDIDKFSNIPVNKDIIKSELGLFQEDYIVISVGELNKNKNHATVIEAISEMKNPNIHYLICGQGTLDSFLKKMIKELGLERQVHLLGFREDIPNILRAADLFIFPSFREGLSVALMEAMAAGLPIISSNIRGNADLINNGVGGYLVSPKSKYEFAEKINLIFSNTEDSNQFGKYNSHFIEKFSRDNVKNELIRIYKSI